MSRIWCQGGAAFVDVLFGAVSPAGRSPVTWYSDDSELPPLTQGAIGTMDLYAHKGQTYRYYQGQPVVPFGAGLSYWLASEGGDSLSFGVALPLVGLSVFAVWRLYTIIQQNEPWQSLGQAESAA